jgi:peptidoglycan/xylan/chitin deacetylase (PgdA/CDA1 family)
MVNPSFLKCVFPWIVWKGPKNHTNAYLTFDDGPHPDHTVQVLRLLRQHQIKAAFFLQGKNVLLYPGVVEQIKKEGHIIGNHGFSHASLFMKKASKILSEIENTDKAIEKITGQRPILFRPPYGHFDPRFRRLLQTGNHRLVIWSLLAYDFRETDPGKIVQTVQTRLHPGAIVVLHDAHRNTPVMLRALPNILKTVRKHNYHFQPLDFIQDNQA